MRKSAGGLVAAPHILPHVLRTARKWARLGAAAAAAEDTGARRLLASSGGTARGGKERERVASAPQDLARLIESCIGALGALSSRHSNGEIGAPPAFLLGRHPSPEATCQAEGSEQSGGDTMLPCFLGHKS